MVQDYTSWNGRNSQEPSSSSSSSSNKKKLSQREDKLWEKVWEKTVRNEIVIQNKTPNLSIRNDLLF